MCGQAVTRSEFELIHCPRPRPVGDGDGDGDGEWMVVWPTVDGVAAVGGLSLKCFGGRGFVALRLVFGFRYTQASASRAGL